MLILHLWWGKSRHGNKYQVRVSNQYLHTSQIHQSDVSSCTTITNQYKFELNLGFFLGSHHGVTSQRVSASLNEG